MRIIGGELGGRRFPGPPGDVTRPTSERVREAIASALDSRHAIRGHDVLDLFAGTGALAFECLSRGSGRATLVDNDRRVVAALAESATTLGLTDRATIRKIDLLGDPKAVAERIAALTHGTASLVFMDAPYADISRAILLPQALIEAAAVREDAFFVVETARKTAPEDIPGLALTASYRYGDTVVLFATRAVHESAVTP